MSIQLYIYFQSKSSVTLYLIEDEVCRILVKKAAHILYVRSEFSGDDAVKTNQGNFLVYVHAGTNPFEVINQGVK